MQEAGNNSQQWQAENMYITVGIDEKRAREIYQEMNLQLRKDYSQEALKIAESRVTEFENKLLPKMEAVEGALEAFADPGFQLLLVEAQKTAASTERPADYDLLSELLIHRYQKGSDRVIRTGISRAVEIVDKISNDALLGLTLIYSVSFIPETGDIQQGLKVLNNLFGKLLYDNLPTGDEWLEHLDILDAIRISNSGRLISIEELYSKTLDGYINIGIEKNSDDYSKALNILGENGLPRNILVDHALNSDYIRINWLDKNNLSSMILERSVHQDNQPSIKKCPLSETQINAIKSIYNLYKTDELIKQQNVRIFMEEWDKQPNLKTLREWWGSIGVSLKLTSIGKILAHSNAQRCANIPSLY